MGLFVKTICLLWRSFFSRQYWPEREISITKPEIAGGTKTPTSYFWGVYGNTSSPPAAATTAKTPAKTTAASRPRARRRPDVVAVFACVFAVVAAVGGLEVFPYTPQK